MIFDYPTDNIFEITIIGTGGGYGESCILHLCDRRWVIIDSCINPFNRNPLPLEYLNNIGVNLETEVKLIVCSHWHNDHIQGIASIFEKCQSSNLSYARINKLREFTQLIRLDVEKGNEISRCSEYYKCLNILRSRGIENLKSAFPDRILYKNNENIISEIISLSPSEEAIRRTDEEIITKFDQLTENRVALNLSENKKSIALLINVGKQSAILGADLEQCNNHRIGWQAIINESTSLIEKSTYIKIPHHGSENGFSKDLWTNYLETNPVSTITPFNKCQNKIPTERMLEHYKSYSDKLYLSSNHNLPKPKKRDKKTQSLMRDFKIETFEEKYNFGIIRSRIDATNKNATWDTQCFGTAYKYDLDS